MLKMWTFFNQHQTFGTHTHTEEPTNIMKQYQVKAARELAQEQTRNGIQNVCGRVASKYLLCLHEEFFQLLGGGLIQLFSEETPRNSRNEDLQFVPECTIIIIIIIIITIIRHTKLFLKKM